MATLQDLIGQIDDLDLRNRILAETNKLLKQKKFGLVFEEHLPECTPLYDVPVKKGITAAKKLGAVSDVYLVVSVDDGMAKCVRKETKETEQIPVADLVSVAEFGEPIYPYLKLMDSVCNAPDSDLWHTLIEADNYHALQLLEYLYAGKVDCIYIDPPYNTGAKDWKYNNDYVDGNDQYRHSKWLSMMEKRLKIAKQLLNPKDAVLMIAIDEKEYLHLGCLLEELFSEADIQMVTTVINAKGAVRDGKFSRVEEYIFVITFGKARVQSLQYNMLDTTSDDVTNEPKPVEWLGFRRREATSVRSARPNQFYPIFVDNESGKIKEIGDRLAYEVPRESVQVPQDCTALWPLKPDGTEMLWGLTPDVARENLKKGYLRVNSWNPNKRTGTVQYLQGGVISGIEKGIIEIIDHREDGSVIAQYKPGTDTISPKRVWNVPAHNAENYGTNMITAILGKRKFSFPKSLYAVEDALKFFVKDKKQALIVDFFAGSGTTLHAVNLLNAKDGGHRRCILVTNNEVSDAEAKNLTQQGYKPGDVEWEKIGIARYVTWPRTVCSIEGHDVNGTPLKGNYLGSDRPMADGFQANAVYFKLGFLDKTMVALGRQFKELLPILWLKSGAHGECPTLPSEEIPYMLILPQNRFAVLQSEESFEEFRDKVNAMPEIETVYIITDYESGYRTMIQSLNASMTYQLYRDYLDNFRINHGRN